ncbi:MAG: TolC family protein [Planctomycetota bacterium]
MMTLRRTWYGLAGLLVVSLLMVGCRASREIRDPEYATMARQASLAVSSPDPALESVPPVVEGLAGPQPVEVYVEFALAQNPDIQAARKRVDAAAHRVPQAASLKDPTLAITVFPEQVQTAAGQQELTMAASQQVPWFGKLRTRAEVAEAATDVARAHLAAVELEVIEQVKRVYYELHFVQKATRITKEDQALLQDLTQIAESKYRTGGTSQQDVLRAQVEVLKLDSELIRLRQQLESAQARLARLLHVSPDTPLCALDQPLEGQVPGDLERLYQAAVAARPELQAQLAALQRDRRSVELARLDYFPDVMAGVTWIATSDGGLSPVANGRDPLLLGLSVNVPIYRKRLEAGVREKEAQAVSTARQYDSLRDQTVAQVKDLFAQATSQYELVRLFRDDIIPKADQTLNVSKSAYGVGDVDFLQLIDNWSQLLRFQIMRHRLESQLQQTLATLERVVGGQLETGLPGEPMPTPFQPEEPALGEPAPMPPATAPEPPQPVNP